MTKEVQETVNKYFDEEYIKELKEKIHIQILEKRRIKYDTRDDYEIYCELLHKEKLLAEHLELLEIINNK